MLGLGVDDGGDASLDDRFVCRIRILLAHGLGHGDRNDLREERGTSSVSLLSLARRPSKKTAR